MKLPTATCGKCGHFPLYLIGVRPDRIPIKTELFLFCPKCGNGQDEPLVVEIWEFDIVETGNGKHG